MQPVEDKKPDQRLANGGRAKSGRRRPLLQRVRRWMLGGVVALLLLLAGFIGYARHRARRALLDLPHLLGADIRSETNGFTYSQTVKGRTLFTIHAAKAVQRQNGKTTLHDVAVTLYGEPGSNRVDSIRGAEFEYDQANGVIRAVGETTLDLASPAAGPGAKPGAKRITVATKGLVFLEKLGVAATDEQIRFEYGATKGEARGAEYDADSGVLRLRHEVHLLSMDNGQVEKVDAEAAEIDRNARTALLHQAVVTDAADTMRAQVLHVQLRMEGDAQPGTIERIRGEGGVQIASSGDTRISAPSLDAEMTEQNRPRVAWFRGGVQLHAATGSGVAGEAKVAFDAAGHANHVDLLHAVRLDAAGAAAGSTRMLHAEQVAAVLTNQGGKHTVLQQATATGQARLTMFDPAGASSKVDRTTVMSGALLRAFGGKIGSSWQISRVEGEGGASLDERDASGFERTSTGDHLVATMQAGANGKHTVSSAGAVLSAGDRNDTAASLQTLVEQGHVRIVERRPAIAARGDVPARAAGQSQATADRAEYDAATQHVLLTGSPEVKDAGTQIAAERIAVDRETGDAEAHGSVKGTYASSGGAAHSGFVQKSAGAAEAGGGTLHFIADRAVLRHGENTAILYGEGRTVRLWNDSGQMDAPVVELDRGTGRMYAHDIAGGSAIGPVRTVLPAEMSRPGKGAGAKARGVGPFGRSAAQTSAAVQRESQPAGAGTVRIVSRDLVYVQGAEGAQGRAEFHGGVRMDSDDGQIASETATAFLRGARGRGGAPMMSDAVERIVAQGRVRLQQPGRIATGDRLVYTAADQQFQMTGADGVPPTVRDREQGTITGASLLFHAGDDSVEVVGADGRPVHTQTVAPARKAASHSTLP